MALPVLSETTIVAIVSALGGSLITPTINYFRDKKKAELEAHRIDSIDAAKLREELWAEVNNLRTEVRELKEDLATWQSRYFRLLADYNDLEVRYNTLSAQVATILADKK